MITLMILLIQLFYQSDTTIVNSSSDLINQTKTLSDGRTIGFAEYGLPNGIPVLYFHGGQESRLSAAFMDSTAKVLGIRLIAPDRPGIGLSTFQANRNFADYAKDIAELADLLGIETFSVFGLSGGSPHVLACAALLPERINRISIISGAIPFSVKGSLDGMWIPVQIIHYLMKFRMPFMSTMLFASDLNEMIYRPDEKIKKLQTYLPDADKNYLKANPKAADEFIVGSIESYKQGLEGVKQEWRLYVTDWNIDINQIPKAITLWYGDEDVMAPVSRGEYLHATLPYSRLNVIPHQGHFSLIRSYQKEILQDLINFVAL